MYQLILIDAGTADFYLLLNRLSISEGFDTALARKSDEAVEIAVGRSLRIIMLIWGPRSGPAAEIQARLKQDDRTAGIPMVALAGKPPGGYWLRRNGRYIRLDPTEFRLLCRLSPRPICAFLHNEPVDPLGGMVSDRSWPMRKGQ